MKMGYQESTGSKNLALTLGFPKRKRKRKRKQVYVEHLEQLCVLYDYIYLILTTMIGHKYYSPDHTDEETEAQRV